MGRLALLSVVLPHAGATGSSCSTDGVGCWAGLHQGERCSLESPAIDDSTIDRWGFLQLTSQVRKPSEPVNDVSDASLLLELMGAPSVVLSGSRARDQVLSLNRNASGAPASEVVLRAPSGHHFPRPAAVVAPTGAVMSPHDGTFDHMQSWPLLHDTLANIAETNWLTLGNYSESGGHLPGVATLQSDNVTAGQQRDAGHAAAVFSHDAHAASQGGASSADFLWLLQQALQASHRSGNLVEGLLLFVLVSFFCCALVSGTLFLWSQKNGTDGEDGHAELPEDKLWTSGGRASNPQLNRMVEERMSSNSSERRRNIEQRPPSFQPVVVAQSYPAQMEKDPVSAAQGPSRHLCPELVVPRGSECILAVRCLVTARLQQVEFDVKDVNGKAVLRVEVSPHFARTASTPWPAGLQRSPTIRLMSLHPRETTGGYVLAYCCNVTKEDTSVGAKRNVYIYQEDDELFAHLMKDEIRKRYVLTSGRLGLQLLFEGNFEEHAVDVTNEARELLACTEPSVMDFDPVNKHYKLRVTADVDVGLVLCGLLAIDQMEVK